MKKYGILEGQIIERAGVPVRRGVCMLIEIIKALLMGIVEGITEWLPCSGW